MHFPSSFCLNCAIPYKLHTIPKIYLATVSKIEVLLRERIGVVLAFVTGLNLTIFSQGAHEGLKIF